MENRNFLTNKIFGIISQTASENGVRAFAIGGFVRDCFLGRPCKDIDVVVEGSGIEIAEKVASRQNAGVLDQYLDAAKALCREKGVPVCDCYGKWKQLSAGGVDTTALLANGINHPTRQLHWLFAYELVRTMLEE